MDLNSKSKSPCSYSSSLNPDPAADSGEAMLKLGDAAFTCSTLYEFPLLFSPFLSLCSLFPCDYDFSKLEMVMLWVSQGLITSDHDHDHDCYDRVFDLLVSMQLLLFSRSNPRMNVVRLETTLLLYQVNHSEIKKTTASSYSAVAIEKEEEQKYLIIWEDKNITNIVVHHPEKVHHLSIDSRSLLDLSGFDFIKQFHCLHTLFLIHTPCYFANQLPYDLFFSLKHLLWLNLSGCSILEVPASIACLKSLIYIDLSYNPMEFLPEGITCLCNLQTLRVRGCSRLRQLPINTNYLTNLRHLDLDVLGQLSNMPRGMGKLIHLETLSGFKVSVIDDGCRIGELKNIKNIKGEFCITNLQCVLNPEEAEEVDLVNKKFITKLDLQWTTIDFDDDEPYKTERILEYLQPPFGIEELSIQNYAGFKVPSWFSDSSSYAHLVDIFIYCFINCDCLPFPSIGQLPSLQSLSIKKIKKLQRIDLRFCRDDNNDDDSGNKGQHSPPAFPRLKELTIDDMPELEEWRGVRDGDFPCLNKLEVDRCPKLISLSFLPCLSSLKSLEITHCPNISSLPTLHEIATSLESLTIIDCPELKKNCQNLKGKAKIWVR